MRVKCKFGSLRAWRFADSIHRRDVATFVNSYPTLEVEPEFVKDEYTSTTPIVLQVALSRDADDEDEDDVMDQYDDDAIEAAYASAGETDDEDTPADDGVNAEDISGQVEAIEQSFIRFACRIIQFRLSCLPARYAPG